jgi:hypothetical protein
MSTSFTGFLAADFDAYTVEKWSSNMWNRQRLEVKQRAMVLGKEVAETLGAAGAALSLGASDEHPSLWNKKKVDCQWVFLWRNEDERKVLEAVVDRDRKLATTLLDPTPFHRHAFLTFRIDAEGLEIALKIHRSAWVDATNLRRKLQTAAGAAEMARLLAVLPDGFRVGVGDESRASSLATPDLLGTLLARHQEGEWFFVSRRVPRDEAIAAGTPLAATVIADFEWLWPLYRFLAWSRDNDFVSIDEALAAEAAERQVARARLEQEEAERADRLARDKDLARERAREKGPTGPAPRPPRTAPAARPSQPPSPPRPEAPPAAPVATEPRGGEGVCRSRRAERAGGLQSAGEGGPRAPRGERGERGEAQPPLAMQVAKGVRVRIGKGPFSGKVGTVQEIDRGVAKVLLGLMAARVDVADLVPVGPGRPGHAERRRA